ncbi:hypothetical protein [Pedobacter kyonggii]|uniref:Uncharacterized protein n=1 Tax=Pedobacter kyonggii TaxID=1926871 RepID=A0A4Q9HGL9_9SPHI|nr:hypothetical protein [Pedobacter kyonggii]TBO44396.1 hypothetical protein EYS08_03545 [Pedobacter kyonggii]
MIQATYEDCDLVAGLLTRSFEDNDIVNYLIPKDKKRIRRISALMQYAFYKCHLQGDVFLSEDHRACALVISPSGKAYLNHNIAGYPTNLACHQSGELHKGHEVQAYNQNQTG